MEVMVNETVVIRVLASASSPGPFADGPWYVQSYDVDAYDGRGWVDLVSDPREAMTFPDVAAAIAAWATQATVNPIRPDGKPNRPLTAWTAEIVPAVRERARAAAGSN